MATAASPTDPLFFLHHANIDRIWAEWQKAHPAQAPPNKTETLKPKPLFGVKVADLLSISGLGYSYQWNCSPVRSRSSSQPQLFPIEVAPPTVKHGPHRVFQQIL